LKILKFFDADLDPDPGIRNLFDPRSTAEKFGSGILEKHPGSATLQKTGQKVQNPNPQHRIAEENKGGED
jgi:hypothetical protein